MSLMYHGSFQSTGRVLKTYDRSSSVHPVTFGRPGYISYSVYALQRFAVFTYVHKYTPAHSNGAK